jgi:hypothetical protein
MLAELFMLRAEAIVRAANQQGATSSDRRFVPIKLPAAVKDSQTPAAKTAWGLGRTIAWEGAGAAERLAS